MKEPPPETWFRDLLFFLLGVAIYVTVLAGALSIKQDLAAIRALLAAPEKTEAP